MQHNGKITLDVLGGGGEVGANCFQITCNGERILLDSGNHPKKEGKAALPEFALINRAPDTVLVSHGHQDHCGSLPYLARQFPSIRTHATVPTLRILDRMLHNSVSVMETIAKERGVSEYPLYTHDDVNFALRHTEGHGFDDPFYLPLDTEVEARFLRAGHVLGAASILLRMPGHTLLYTGDVCERDQELLPGMTPYERDWDVDTLIIESTHGATEEARYRPYPHEAKRLGEAITGVLENGGVALVPCFALGRMQELLNVLARLQEEGAIPYVPIYASGLGRAVYELYDRYYDYLLPETDLRPLEEFPRIGNVWDKTVAEELLSEPAILVATSGMMLPNTPSAMIAQEMVKHTHHGIFFAGYLDHETLGYKLLHAQPGARLQFSEGRQEVEIKLQNIKRFTFTAHAPRSVLRGIIERVKPKNVVYVHGDPDAIGWMQQHTGNGSRTYAPGIGQTVALEA